MLSNLALVLEHCDSMQEMADTLGIYEERELIKIFPFPGELFGKENSVLIVLEETGGNASPDDFHCLVLDRFGAEEYRGRESLNMILSACREVMKADDEENSTS